MADITEFPIETVVVNDPLVKGDVLGTVSQSAGVPTGAIIERGSNANGEFVKYADGTQICTFSDSNNGPVTTVASSGGFMSEKKLRTFAASFITSPKVNHSAWRQSDDINLVSSAAAAVTSTGFSQYVHSINSNDLSSFSLQYTAIGRWF